MSDYLALRRSATADTANNHSDTEDATAPLIIDQTTSRSARVAACVTLLALYLYGWALLVLSWLAAYHMLAVTGHHTAQRPYLAYVSVVLSCASYTVWGIMVKHGPPPGPRQCMRSLLHARQLFRRDGWRDSCLKPTKRCLRHIIHYSLIMLPSIILVVAYKAIDFSDLNDMATKELSLWILLALWDAVVAYIITAILIVQAVGILCPRSKSPTAVPAVLRRWSCTPQRVAAVLVVCVTLLIAGNIAAAVMSTEDALEMARGTVLGEPGKDFCAAVGMQLDPKKLKGGWVLPAMLPRRFFNFYLGSEKCRPEGQVPLGLIDEEAEVLVVPTRCPASSEGRGTFPKPQTPRVFLETPYKNLYNADEPHKDFGQHAKLFQKMLEEKYRDDTSVIVHRSARGSIMSVEIKPESLTVTETADFYDEEDSIRPWWSGALVFVIPLGRSMTYTVRCDGAGIEDYFIHPLTPTAPQSSDTTAVTAGSTTDEPPANVLAFFFDSVSRQDVVRSLPRFTQWLQNFKQHGPHRVLEARSHTTLGTSRDFAPLLSGTSLELQGIPERYRSSIDFSKRTIFSLVKQRYGPRVQTSFNSAYCQDTIQVMFGRREEAMGYGDASGGVDQLMLEPMCHTDYARPKHRYNDAYDIHKRCMGNTHVHEHLLGYTKALLRQRLREIKASMNKPGKGRFFFDMTYFIEGHEGSHGVLGLMDEALVDFMEELRVDLEFFDDPRNAVVLFSDHGNSMGPYAAFFEGGKLEQTMPFLIFIIHPETFKRVDRRRGWAEGSSEVAMAQRVHNVTTQADLYMTLADLTGVDAYVEAPLTTAPSPPQSLFNPFTATGHTDVVVNKFFEQFLVDPLEGQTPGRTGWCA